MAVALQGQPKTAFTPPTAEILRGKKVPIPSTAGLTPEAAKKKLEAAGFVVATRNIFDTAPPGTFISVTCEGYIGGQCYLNYSKGPRPPEEAEAPR
jgi:hypothetical protein